MPALPAHALPPAVNLKSPDGAAASISPYGAHVLSWVPAAGSERLFLSPRAEFRAGAAIRGGVPLIFPQFNTLGSLPKHGFARTQPWKLAKLEADHAVFWLSETEATRQIWPHRFLAEYTVRIGANQLSMRLSITNTDASPFDFTVALHTYLQVDDVRKSWVSGLDGVAYSDSSAGVQAGRLTFQGEVDRIYFAVPGELQLGGGARALAIRAEGFPDAVLWNPGAEKCAALADMEPDGYLQFVCVEAAAVASPLRLAPGENWQGSQTLIV
jgi:glucose-6-phosphate 1-epimerase